MFGQAAEDIKRMLFNVNVLSHSKLVLGLIVVLADIALAVDSFSLPGVGSLFGRLQGGKGFINPSICASVLLLSWAPKVTISPQA